MHGREDLGAQLARVTRWLVAHEQPLLDRHGLTTWEYAALLRLRTDAAETQIELANAIRYDKTRLVALLDGLQDRGLIERQPDPGDRRAHTVRLTRGGRAKVDALQRDIHAMEDELLATAERERLQRLLASLLGESP